MKEKLVLAQEMSVWEFVDLMESLPFLERQKDHLMITLSLKFSVLNARFKRIKFETGKWLNENIAKPLPNPWGGALMKFIVKHFFGEEAYGYVMERAKRKYSIGNGEPFIPDGRKKRKKK